MFPLCFLSSKKSFTEHPARPLEAQAQAQAQEDAQAQEECAQDECAQEPPLLVLLVEGALVRGTFNTFT